jgi:hypothetical protein
MKPSHARPQTSREPGAGLVRAEVLEVIDRDTVLARRTAHPAAEVVRAEIAVPGGTRRPPAIAW